MIWQKPPSMGAMAQRYEAPSKRIQFCIRFLDSVWDGFFPKELSLCHKLWFLNTNILTTQCCKTLDISNYDFCYIKQSKFERSKFYIIWLILDIYVLENLDLLQRLNSFAAKHPIYFGNLVVITFDNLYWILSGRIKTCK